MSNVANSEILRKFGSDANLNLQPAPVQSTKEAYTRLSHERPQTGQSNASNVFPSEIPAYYYQPVEECDFSQTNVHRDASSFGYKSQASLTIIPNTFYNSHRVPCQSFVHCVSPFKRLSLNDHPQKLPKKCAKFPENNLPTETDLELWTADGSFAHSELEQITTGKEGKLLGDLNKAYMGMVPRVPGTILTETNMIAYDEDKPLWELYCDAFQPIDNSMGAVIEEVKEEEIVYEQDVFGNESTAEEGKRRNDVCNLQQYYVYPVSYEPHQHFATHSFATLGAKTPRPPGKVTQFRKSEDTPAQRCAWLCESEPRESSYTYIRSYSKDEQSQEGSTKFRDYFAKYNTETPKKTYEGSESETYFYNESYIDCPPRYEKSSLEEYLAKEESNLLAEKGLYANPEQHQNKKEHISRTPYQDYVNQRYSPGLQPQRNLRVPQTFCDNYDCKGYSCTGLPKKLPPKGTCTSCKKPCKGPCGTPSESKTQTNAKIKHKSTASKLPLASNEYKVKPCPFRTRTSKSKEKEKKKAKLQEDVEEGESSSCFENCKQIVSSAITELKSRILPVSVPTSKDKASCGDLAKQDLPYPCADKTTATEMAAKTSPTYKMSAGDCQCVLQYVLKKIENLETSLKEQKKEIDKQKELKSAKSVKKIKKHKSCECPKSIVQFSESQIITEIHKPKDRPTKKISLVSVLKETKILDNDENENLVVVPCPAIKASSSRKETSSRKPSKHFTIARSVQDREGSSSACSCNIPSTKNSFSKRSKSQNAEEKFISMPSTSKAFASCNNIGQDGNKDADLRKSKHNAESLHEEGNSAKLKRRPKKCACVGRRASLSNSVYSNFIAVLLFFKKYPCRYVKYLLFM